MPSSSSSPSSSLHDGTVSSSPPGRQSSWVEFSQINNTNTNTTTTIAHSSSSSSLSSYQKTATNVSSSSLEKIDDDDDKTKVRNAYYPNHVDDDDDDDDDDDQNNATMKNSNKNNDDDDDGALISALSNFSIQYNMGVIAPALLLLDPRGAIATVDNNSTTATISYPRSKSFDSLLKSFVFVGAIMGQSFMGFLGDAIGLERAMIATNVLSLVGTIGCTMAPFLGRYGSSDEDATFVVYAALVVFRGVLGVGVGGKYPLASAIRAESAERKQSSLSSSSSSHQNRAEEVARGFFWQTPGAIAPYVLSFLLLFSFDGTTTTNRNDDDDATGGGGSTTTTMIFMYVLLVGIGAVPSAMVVFLTYRQYKRKRLLLKRRRRSERPLLRLPSSNDDDDDDDSKRPPSSSTMRVWDIPSTMINDVTLLRKFLGTGLTWCLYDIIYYGTAFNQPEILSRALGHRDDDDNNNSLMMNSLQNAVIASMGLPGVMSAVRLLGDGRMGLKPLQGWGFLMIGVNCAVLSLSYRWNIVGRWWGVFMMSCLIFSLNWGCNVSTYVLPMETFPRGIRTSFHGLSAAMGKFGAFLGTYFFTRLNAISISLTFGVCAMLCVVGIGMTWCFVDPPYRGTFVKD